MEPDPFLVPLLRVLQVEQNVGQFVARLGELLPLSIGQRGSYPLHQLVDIGAVLGLDFVQQAFGFFQHGSCLDGLTLAFMGSGNQRSRLGLHAWFLEQILIVGIFLRTGPQLIEPRSGAAALGSFKACQGVVDRDFLLQAGGPLAGGDLQDAVEVQIELDEDRIARRDWRQSLDQEFADAMIMSDIFALALIDVDLHLGLSVRMGVEHLTARRRQGRIAMDDRDETEPEGISIGGVEALDAERMGRDVDEDGADIDTGDDGSLNGGAHGHAQVGVDLLMRRLVEPILQQRRR